MVGQPPRVAENRFGFYEKWLGRIVVFLCLVLANSSEKPRFQKVMIGRREVRLVEFGFNLDESTTVRYARINLGKPWADFTRIC